MYIIIYIYHIDIYVYNNTYVSMWIKLSELFIDYQIESQRNKP